MALVLGASAQCLGSCATPVERRVDDATNLVRAVVATSDAYDACLREEMWMESHSQMPSGMHSGMPDCVAARVVEPEHVDLCATPSNMRASAYRAVRRAMPDRSLELPYCGNLHVARPTMRSLVEVLDLFTTELRGGDGLYGPSTPLRGEARISTLRVRCWLAEGPNDVVRPGARPSDFSRGEAILCASLSVRWSTEKLAAYWPALTRVH